MGKVVNEPLGRRVLQRRTARGLSQPQLARLSGISQQNIASIERGLVKRPGRALELADALHTTVEWLLDARGPEVVKRYDPAEEALSLLKSTPRDRLGDAIEYLKSLQDGSKSHVA